MVDLKVFNFFILFLLKKIKYEIEHIFIKENLLN